LYVLLQNAWVSDDAFITLRTVSNAWNGYGLTWNTFERVQAYTHPLWMFLLLGAHAITGEYFYTTIGVSLLCSLFALSLLLRNAFRSSGLPGCLFITALIVTSKALIDYTSSGLENPLVFLLIAFCWNEAVRPKIRLDRLVVIGSLLYVTRPDSILLVAPLIGLTLWKHRQNNLSGITRAILIGSLPALAWTGFSLVYYGFPFPNTAYAKLGTGIDRMSLIQQGGAYLWNSLVWDPLTIPVIALAAVAGAAFGHWRERAVAAGVFLYLLYTVSVGGDFMSGRFLAAPFFTALILIAARLPSYRPILASSAALLVLILGATIHPRVPWRTDGEYKSLGLDRTRIADERGHYFDHLGFSNYLRRDRTIRQGTRIMHRAYQAGLRARIERRKVARREAIGMYGFAAGPSVRVIDTYALSDPLLARLPAVNRTRWRIGHFTRRVPPGYDQSVMTGENLIENPDLREFYGKLKIITQGPIWSWERFKTIAFINTGRYSALLDSYNEESTSNSVPAPST
jgi:arabinofuranosyltransferase